MDCTDIEALAREDRVGRSWPVSKPPRDYGEPWEVLSVAVPEGVRIRRCDGTIIGINARHEAEEREVAARIAACVSACKGLAERPWLPPGWIAAQFEANYEMLEVLRPLLHRYCPEHEKTITADTLIVDSLRELARALLEDK